MFLTRASAQTIMHADWNYCADFWFNNLTHPHTQPAGREIADGRRHPGAHGGEPENLLGPYLPLSEGWARPPWMQWSLRNYNYACRMFDTYSTFHQRDSSLCNKQHLSGSMNVWVELLIALRDNHCIRAPLYFSLLYMYIVSLLHMQYIWYADCITLYHADTHVPHTDWYSTAGMHAFPTTRACKNMYTHKHTHVHPAQRMADTVYNDDDDDVCVCVSCCVCACVHVRVCMSLFACVCKYDSKCMFVCACVLVCAARLMTCDTSLWNKEVCNPMLCMYMLCICLSPSAHTVSEIPWHSHAHTPHHMHHTHAHTATRKHIHSGVRNGRYQPPGKIFCHPPPSQDTLDS